MADWTDEARLKLQTYLDRRGNWGYKRGGKAAIEPSVLSCLGLLASGSSASTSSDLTCGRATAQWLSAIQRSDGSLPVMTDVETPAWSTPYAILLWNAVGTQAEARSRARACLLNVQGQSLPRDELATRTIGHDPTMRGWPWVESTHSWVEPSALAALALCREGLHEHQRVRSGIQLILNRSLPSGGWNYGNSAVLGRELRAQPAPTALALLALASHGENTIECRRGIDYLRQALREVRAGTSLGWGVLGLRAWDACPRAAATWLGESYRRHEPRPDEVVSLALLLLAESKRGLEFFVKPGAAGAGSPPREHVSTDGTEISS